MTYLRDTKFLICCCARSGSTFLVDMLRSHPDIMVHGESLTTGRPGMIWGSYHRKRKLDQKYDAALGDMMRQHPERFIQSILFDAQDRKIAGFKFKTDELFDPQYKPYADVVFDDTDIKVIHLTRRNLLNQYISHNVVLTQTGVTVVHNEKDIPVIKPFKVDPNHALDYFAAMVRKEQKALECFSKHRCVSVEYEILARNDGGDRVRTLDFLGVPQRPLSTKIKKIIKNSRALVTNMEALIEILCDAGFENRISFASCDAQDQSNG